MGAVVEYSYSMWHQNWKYVCFNHVEVSYIFILVFLIINDWIIYSISGSMV